MAPNEELLQLRREVNELRERVARMERMPIGGTIPPLLGGVPKFDGAPHWGGLGPTCGPQVGDVYGGVTPV